MSKRFRVTRQDEEVLARLKSKAMELAKNIEDQEERAQFLMDLGYAFGLVVKLEQDFELYYGAVEGALT